MEDVKLDLREAINLGAADSEFFARVFFPKTFRQASPSFAKTMWAPLDDPRERLVNLICFRGSTKTTRLRTFAAKRIAYGTSRTILLIGASQPDAIRSVAWLRNQIERNKLFAGAFGLRPGRKWEETQIEIETGFGHTVWVQGAGITGSLRGINFDDYRPDLIIADDPQTDEMASTLEQRNKVSDLLLGAVKNSLAPASEEPNAKLVMAITPQHRDDISQQALRDESWSSVLVPCWTTETLHNSVDEQESAWPERFPTADLRKDKRQAIRRNRLSIFCREMECRLVSPETSVFRGEWLNVRERGVHPEGGFCVLAIDPVPPPSDRELAKGLAYKDFEAQYVWGRFGSEYHLLDMARNRGHQPSWSIATALTLARKWRVTRIVVEAVAYQRVLKWHLEQEMQRRGIYYQVVAYNDKRSKSSRIIGTLSGLATAGRLYIGEEHSDFASQWLEYPNCEHDDDLDASAIALSEISKPYVERAEAGNDVDNDVEEIEWERACP